MLFNSTKKTPHDAAQQVSDATKLLGSLQPVLQKVYSNKASLLFSSGFHYVGEFLYYIIAIACFGFIFIMNSVFPFHLLGEIVSRPAFRDQISNSNDINSFHFAVKALVALAGILFLMLGMKQRSVRRRSILLHSAGAELKKVETYLNDKIMLLDKLQEEESVNIQVQDKGTA